MAEREARYGLNTYRVHVNPTIYDTPSVFVSADSLTVTSIGALILAVEVEPIENLEQTTEGDIRRRADASGIDLPPVAVFAPGHWYAAVMVDFDTHQPSFFENIEGEDFEDEDFEDTP
jgi:hypothetical protein